MAYLLAIETSSDACSVAISTGTEIYQTIEHTPRQHTHQLLPQINQLLKNVGATLQQLDAIAFSCGPGSFTGIRLAASVVQGLAFGADLPVIPISTLQVLAQGVYRDLGAQYIAIATDACGGSIYWGSYQEHSGIMQPLMADSCLSAEAAELPLNLLSEQWTAAGEGWKVYAEILMNKFPTIQYYPSAYPQAQDVLPLAAIAYEQGNYVSAAQALPVYLYAADRWRKQ